MEDDTKYIGSAITTDTKQNNGFMRAMSPVTVDHYSNVDTMPLTSGLRSPTEKYSNKRSVAIEDPYSSEPVMFSMMDMGQNNNSRYGSPIPMRGMSPRFDTTSPTNIRRPSWERPTQYKDQNSGYATHDWV